MKFHNIDCVGRLLIQRLTSAQRGATTASVGRLVYDTDLGKMYYGDGVGWNEIGTGSSPTSTEFYPFIPITGTSDEGGLLGKEAYNGSSVSGTYAMSNFTGSAEFDNTLINGLYIRCWAKNLGTFALSVSVSCTLPDGSTRVICAAFNEFTFIQEATGVGETIFIPVDPQTVSVTVTLTSFLYGGCGYTIVGALQVSRVVTIASGFITPYTNITPPFGWLLCDGSAISRTTYADLFTIIGTTYGSGDLSTTFNIPDLRGRFPLGENPISGPSGIDRVDPGTLRGAVGGEFEHQITVDELPSHNHEFSSEDKAFSGSDKGAKDPGIYDIGPAGGDVAHNTTPPYQAVYYIIKI